MAPADDWKLQLAQSLGELTGEVSGMAGKVDRLTDKVDSLESGVNSKISSVHQSIATLVRREDCQFHMAGLHTEIAQVSATAQAAATAAADTEGRMDEVTDQMMTPTGEHQSLWERTVKHSQGLTSILIFLGMIGGGLWAFFHFMGRVNSTLEASEAIRNKQQEEVARMIAAAGAKTVYVYSHAPDAGVAPVYRMPLIPTPRKSVAPPRRPPAKR